LLSAVIDVRLVPKADMDKIPVPTTVSGAFKDARQKSRAFSENDRFGKTNSMSFNKDQ
jgi:hypothetical protein